MAKFLAAALFILIYGTVGNSETCTQGQCLELESEASVVHLQYQSVVETKQVAGGGSEAGALGPGPGKKDVKEELEEVKDYTEEEFGPNADLAMVLPLVVVNLTNYSGLIGAKGPNVTHVFGDVESDTELLLDMVSGFVEVLHDHMPPKTAKKYCPMGDVSVIKRCVDIAICLLQQDVGTADFTLETYMLYEETVSRIDDIGWETIQTALQIEGESGIPDSYWMPSLYECDGTYDWLYADVANKIESTDGPCASLGGSYVSDIQDGNIVFTQIDCSGVVSISGDKWTYTVTGNDIVFTTEEGAVTATASGVYGSYSITFDNGDVITELGFESEDDADDEYDPPDTESGSSKGTKLLQTSTSRTQARALAAALRTSTALDMAARATHEILDAHGSNSSMNETIRQLERAWEPACRRLQCDHTNYHELYGASHDHSLALIETGASARHVRSHIRGRLRLENRMQRFLGKHGEHGGIQVYRAAGNVESQMQKYTSRGRRSMMHFMERYFSVHGNQLKIAKWVNRDNLKAYFLDHSNESEFVSYYQAAMKTPTPLDKHEVVEEEEDEEDEGSASALIQTGEDEGEDESLMEDEGSAGALIQTGESEGDSDTLAGRRRRRRRRRRRFLGRRRRRIFQAVVNAANAVASAVTTAVNFLVDTFACFGQAKSMYVIGYCRKWTFDAAQTQGVGVGFTMANSVSLNQLIQGNVVQGAGIGMSVVMGFIPGPPHEPNGVRTGVGIGGSVGCNSAGSCSVGIAVGVVASALISTNDPGCVAGPWLSGFRCMAAAGGAITAVCCNFNLVTGQENCR